MTGAPLPEVTAEGLRVGQAALDAGVGLKLTGGVAVWQRCPRARTAPLARQYADVDFVGRACDKAAIVDLLEELRYVQDAEFNALHGASRLFFWDRENDRQLDVFLDRVEMCHELDLSDRLGDDAITIPIADLLLMKLQIYETNDKDYLDIIALLADHQLGEDDRGIDLGRITGLLGADWGWWRTCTEVAARAAAFARELTDPDLGERVTGQVEELERRLEAVPKGRRWKLRARVGDRARWYELPEETH